ncbi:gephyrin-like molybdotransferase Glp [Arenibaculum sp.]|jgi:molybdopterin molybdotransferase|uniref:molybdopterin molybdotransferase MoeA n=1 Tax=Arenibaculum sp. TaxID=2865862 RepID=UPI002E103AA3|nr:gephyrin-like molybdotransferase Glp [Arenibaculum sp.]
MIPVADALERMLSAVAPLPAETVALPDGLGRVLAADVAARVTQPPVAVSAMDGYAVRGADVATAPARLRRIGEVAAGARFEGTVGPGEAVRIFTGAPVPAGADTVVIQEDTTAEGEAVVVAEPYPAGRYVRRAGLDFTTGTVGLTAGRRLGARDIGLAAAMNVPWLSVHRRPRVAILATGDEIVMPGEPIGPSQIVSSNALALAALVATAGGDATNLGIARDDARSLTAHAEAARGFDLLVTTGGASVGEHDLVRSVLGERGMRLDFYKIAMRPGKPLMFGRFGDVPLLGLPGNPVSSMVCGLLFLRPLLRRLQGLADTSEPVARATLGIALAENDGRQDYLRARLERGPSGELVAHPFPLQDSSVMSLLAAADCLVVRPPRAPAARPGDPVDILPLSTGILPA